MIEQFRVEDSRIPNATDRTDRTDTQTAASSAHTAKHPLSSSERSSQQYCSAVERFRTEQQTLSLVSCSTSVIAFRCRAVLRVSVFPSRPVGCSSQHQW